MPGATTQVLDHVKETMPLALETVDASCEVPLIAGVTVNRAFPFGVKPLPEIAKRDPNCGPEDGLTAMFGATVGEHPVLAVRVWLTLVVC